MPIDSSLVLLSLLFISNSTGYAVNATTVTVAVNDVAATNGSAVNATDITIADDAAAVVVSSPHYVHHLVDSMVSALSILCSMSSS